jgi:hypothetical protein
MIETFSDFFMSVGWIAGFIALLNNVRTGCSVDTTGFNAQACTNFNWLVAWLFFLFVAWTAGLVFDILSWKKGVCDVGEIDSDVLLDVRRATRSSRLK